MPPLLLLHIAGATVGIVSGAAAMAWPKATRGHYLAGQSFFVSMLVMSTSAVYLAVMKSQWSNVLGGTFTAYLVLTAWITARRREKWTNSYDVAALVPGIAAAGGGIWLGYAKTTGMIPDTPDAPAAAAFIFGSVAVLAVIGDVRMLMGGGIAGKARIKRHIWRMCTAMFIATASFFLGKQDHFPEALQGSVLMLVPVFAVLVMMAYWLVRYSFTGVYRRLLPRLGADLSYRAAGPAPG